jgi:hypothetical protein
MIFHQSIIRDIWLRTPGKLSQSCALILTVSPPRSKVSQAGGEESRKNVACNATRGWSKAITGWAEAVTSRMCAKLKLQATLSCALLDIRSSCGGT